MSRLSPPVGFSALGRSIDPSYPSNVLAVAVAAGTAMLFGGYNLLAPEALPSSWLTASGGVFLAWAIGRELDPDNSVTAAVAMPIAFLSSLAAAPSLLFAFGVLTATRLTTGSAGVGLKTLDMVSVVAIGALLGTGPVSLVTVPALALGVIMVDGGSRRGVLLAGSTILAGAVAATLSGPWPLSRELTVASILLAVATVAAAGLVIPAPSPQSKGDVGDERLVGWRVTAARAAAAAAVVAAGIMAGGKGIESAFGTVGAALVAVMTMKFLPRKGSEE